AWRREMLPSLMGRSAVLEPRPITNSSLFTGNFWPLKITNSEGMPPRCGAPPPGKGGGKLPVAVALRGGAIGPLGAGLRGGANGGGAVGAFTGAAGRAGCALITGDG